MQASRTLRASAIALILLAALGHTGCFLPSASAPAYYLAAPLAPIGGGPGSGRVEVFLTPLQRSFFVAIEGLAPGADYTVLVGASTLTTLSTDESGRSSLSLGIAGPHLDPRGRRISVLDPDGNEVLEIVAPDHPAFAEAEVAPLSSFGTGGGFVQSTRLAGQHSFTATVQGAEPGSYDLVVNGESVATLDAADGSGSAHVAPPLFDPRDAAIEVQLDGVGFFAGSGRAAIEGLDYCAPGGVEQELFAAIAGQGRARLTTLANCRRRFDVEIGAVPMGSYDVLIDGVVRTSIAVGSDENGMTSGSVRFASGEASSHPLDFEPIGRQVEVRVGDEVWFTLESFQP